jgi:hypothetical protein
MHGHVKSSRRLKIYPSRTSEDVLERFNNAGPSARLCLEYTPFKIREFYAVWDGSINLEKSQQMVTTFIGEEDHRLRIDSMSHRLCVIRRSNLGISPFTVEPISTFIRQLLLNQLWMWYEENRLSMIDYFSRVPGAGGITGLLFESLYQYRFAGEIDIEAMPMFQTGNRHSRWHAAFGDFSANPTSQKAKEDALKAGLPPLCLSLQPEDALTHNFNSQLVIEEDYYYMPLADNQVGIDSFIVHDGHLYLFQFTSGTDYSVNDGLLTTLSRISPLPASENQHFIFVVPSDSPTFDCPNSEDGFLKNHVPYVVQVEMGHT